jgi:hypothetical protein
VAPGVVYRWWGFEFTIYDLLFTIVGEGKIGEEDE